MSNTPEERFWAKVDATGDCWTWTGARFKTGYGAFRFQGKTARAHRVAWWFLVGRFDPELDHLCRNRACVNPDHLEAIDRRTHNARGYGGAHHHRIKTHCPAGHPYDEQNTYLIRGKWRDCRTCQRIRGAVWMKKKRTHAN